jgi:hypothetical protein
MKWALPNTRVQRTRVPRFARARSPLTRSPLGDHVYGASGR